MLWWIYQQHVKSASCISYEARKYWLKSGKNSQRFPVILYIYKLNSWDCSPIYGLLHCYFLFSTLQKISVDFTVKWLATSCQSIPRYFFIGARNHFQEPGTVSRIAFGHIALKPYKGSFERCRLTSWFLKNVLKADGRKYKGKWTGCQVFYCKIYGFFYSVFKWSPVTKISKWKWHHEKSECRIWPQKSHIWDDRAPRTSSS